MAVFYSKNCILKAAHSEYLADCGWFWQLIGIEITAKSMKLWLAGRIRWEKHIKIGYRSPNLFHISLVEP